MAANMRSQVGWVAPSSSGTGWPSSPWSPSTRPAVTDPIEAFGNTTIGVVVTNARLDKTACLLVAQSGHDGLARSIFPSHTRFDGDALVAAATGSRAAPAAVDDVRMLAVAAVELAVRSVGDRQ